MSPRRSPIANLVFFISLLFIAGSLGNATLAVEQTTAKDVEAKTVQALKTIGSYTAEQRDEAVGKAKETLDALDTRIDQLESRFNQDWDHMDQTARTKGRQTLAILRKQRTEAAEWYGALKHSSGKAWEDVKSGFLESYQKLQGAFDKAAKEF